MFARIRERVSRHGIGSPIAGPCRDHEWRVDDTQGAAHRIDEIMDPGE
jgi:hypothetical protein